MKKYLLISLILIFGASTLLAQDGEKIEYKTYKVEQDGFSVDVPKDFALNESDKKDDKYRFYSYPSPELYLFVYSHEKSKDSPNKLLIDLASDNTAIIKHLALKNFDADKYEFLDKEGFYQKIIIVPGKKRNLIFHSVSTTQNNPSVNRFFSSLKFNNVEIPQILASEFFNVEIKNIQPKIEDKILVPTAKPDNKSGGGSGNGNGAGIGSGGSGSGNGRTIKQTDNTIAKGETVALKLLSNPRPGYTDLARIYGVQGIVTLRVTFLASGEIGSVSPVTKLPFGLTLKSIKVAKLIKFESPKRNGVAYSITKSVQFSYSIY